MGELVWIMDTHSVKYNFIMNIIVKISSFIIPLIALPYITHVLGAGGSGKVAFANSVISYFLIIAQLGIPTYGVRICAQVRNDKENLTKTVQELLIINLFMVVVSYMILGLMLVIVPRFRTERPLLLLISSGILLNSIGMEWLYQATEQYRYIAVRNISFKIVSLILMFLLVKESKDYIAYGVVLVMGSYGSNLFNLYNSRKILLMKRYNTYELKRHLRPIMTFFALSVAVSIYTNMDTIMLGFIAGDVQVGYYNLATKIKIVLAMVVSALGPVVLPRVSFYLEQNEWNNFYCLCGKSLHFVVIIVIPVTIYFIVMAKQTIYILGGSEYAAAIPCMQMIMLALLPLGVGNIACMQILTPLGKEKLTMYSTIVGAIVNLLANAICIPPLGAVGAAVGTVLAEIIVAGIQVYYARDILKKIVKGIPLCKIFATSLISIFVMLLLKVHVSLLPLLQIVATAIVFFGTYFLLLLFFQETLVCESWKILKSFVNPKQNDSFH